MWSTSFDLSLLEHGEVGVLLESEEDVEAFAACIANYWGNPVESRIRQCKEYFDEYHPVVIYAIPGKVLEYSDLDWAEEQESQKGTQLCAWRAQSSSPEVGDLL